jgi:prevent-host-death family protein
VLSVERIGIRELNQRTSHYIAKVKAGQTIEVTEHGQLVARLVPVQQATSRLDELIAEGKARPGTGEPLDFSWLQQAEPDGINIADEIVKMREEERY